MWNTLSRLDAGVQRVSGWLWVLIPVGAAALSWLSKHVTRFGPIGWPEAILLGVAATCAVALAISFAALLLVSCLSSWRKFKPLPDQSGAREMAASPQINSLIASVEALRRNDEAVLLRIMELVDKQAGLAESLKMVAITAGEANGGVTAIKEQLKKAVDRIEAETQHAVQQNAVIASSKSRIDSLFSSIRSMAHRETLADLAGPVVRIGEVLRSAASEPHDASYWRSWSASQTSWREFVDRWLMLAQRYDISARYSVYHTPEHKYDSRNWNFDDSIFPTFDDAHKFKSFAIIYDNFEQVKSGVDTTVYKAIFADSGADLP